MMIRWILLCAAVLAPNASVADFVCTSPTGLISLQTHACMASWKSEPLDGPPEMRLIIRSYDEMKDKLRTGNIEGALLHFTEDARPRYRKNFEFLGPRLAAAVDGLGRVANITFDEDTARLALHRDTPKGVQGFQVSMRKIDRAWQISGM